MTGVLGFILVGSFLTVTIMIVVIYQSVYGSRMAVLQRLNRATVEVSFSPEEAVERGNLRGGLLRWMGILGSMVPWKPDLKNIQKNLIRARFYLKSEEFIGLTVITGVAVFLFLVLVSGSFLLGAAAGLLGLKLPGILVEARKKKISETITEDLPEALSIITSGLRAGFSFPQAVSVVCKEMEGPLVEEWERVLRENRLGKPMDEALGDLSERTDNDELDLMITSLLIQKQVGGNLAEVLDNISFTIRERVRMKGEIKTLTAEGRASALILSLLPVVVAGMIFIINPGYVATLLQEPLGIAMIVLALIMQIVGIMIICKIVNVEV